MDNISQAIAEANAGNLKGAASVLERVLRANPRDARAWYLLSQVETNNTKAQEYVKKVLEIAPDNQQARDRLAKLEAEAKRFEEIEISAPQPPAESFPTKTNAVSIKGFAVVILIVLVIWFVSYSIQQGGLYWLWYWGP